MADDASELEKKYAHINKATQDLQKVKASVSEEKKVYEAEQRILTLMKEFSDLGVNLNSAPPCKDPERSRYNTADSKLNEIRSIAQAHGLWNKYRYSLNINSSISVWQAYQ
jgi:hypothetical protein